MLRSKFIGTVLVLILGVNLGAWTLRVATSPSSSVASLSVPISAPAIDARSQAASVDLTQAPAAPVPENEAVNELAADIAVTANPGTTTISASPSQVAQAPEATTTSSSDVSSSPPPPPTLVQ